MTGPTPFELLRRHENIQRVLDEARTAGTDMIDAIHAAHQAGFDLGYAAGQMAASIELARQWLLDLAKDDEYVATGMAGGRHGDGWANLIRDQARLPSAVRTLKAVGGR